MWWDVPEHQGGRAAVQSFAQPIHNLGNSSSIAMTSFLQILNTEVEAVDDARWRSSESNASNIPLFIFCSDAIFSAVVINSKRKGR